MGPGHLGVGFAAKSIAPKAPLWLLLVASELTDILFYIFAHFGLDLKGADTTDFKYGVQVIKPGYIPWSHGLIMNIIWASIAAIIVMLTFKNRRIAFATWIAVLSHWVLDFIVHPGLPLWFDKLPNVGLYLWGTGTGLIFSLIIEFCLLAAGIVLYILIKKNPLCFSSNQKNTVRPML